jgi:hypothetical protein
MHANRLPRNATQPASAALAALLAAAVAAQAGTLDHLSVVQLDTGAGDAARAWAVTTTPGPDFKLRIGGEVRVAGQFDPAWWDDPYGAPVMVASMGFGGRVRDVMVQGPLNMTRGAGVIDNAAGVGLPAFWMDPATVVPLPALPGGGVVRDMAFDSATGEFIMCGWTLDAAGQRFAAYWFGNVAGGFFINLLPPLSAANDSAAHAILRDPAGTITVVGYSEGPAGNEQACYWQNPAAWALTVLAPLPGGASGSAECALVTSGLTGFIAGESDAAGDMHPVLWPQTTGFNPVDLNIPTTFDSGIVSILRQLGPELVALGSMTDAAGLESAAGWLVTPGMATMLGDLNARVVTQNAPRLQQVMDAVTRPESWGTGLYVIGTGDDAAGDPQAFLARDLIRGDANCDGQLDFFDIDAFLLALFDQPGYAAAYPGCYPENSDVDGSGNVDFFDIDPFVACLFGACP